MRTWLVTGLKLLGTLYFVLTSLYCLLAFLPYTYFALIKAPPYEWMPRFAQHQAIFYWLAALALAVATWTKEKSVTRFALLGALAAAGVYVTFRPFLPSLENNWNAYRWGLLALAPLALVTGKDVCQYWPDDRAAGRNQSQFPYSTAVLIATLAAALYRTGVMVRAYLGKHPLNFSWGGMELTAWSVISHTLVALILVSLLNLFRLASWRTRHPRSLNTTLIGISFFGILWVMLARFFSNSLSFEGWEAHLYAACFSAALTLSLSSVVLPFFARRRDHAITTQHSIRKVLALAIAVTFSLVAVLFPVIVGGGDWNGVLQQSFAVCFWIIFSACMYLLRPQRRTYSVVTIVGVVLLSGFAYTSLQATEILWAKPLGATDDDVSRSMEAYAAQDASFQLAHHVLGNTRTEACGDLCRILREYTNIRDAVARTEVRLVDTFTPTHRERPNIFILVIDSMRPDYLGAYNPQVDFTPNLDAFAHDSIVVHNVYTQYAGTTLSEPAIWSGMMLLHAHYLQPFSRVNSLERLANTDGYQMVVSFDTVLSQILSPSDNLIKLDTDKPLWNRFEVCSTLQQTESVLDHRRDNTRPVLFYAQPMNVHQFAHNNLPMMNSQNWRTRTNFNNRIAYEVHQVDGCLGSFFAFLKSRGLYDNSIVIVTSDHGDATGEFGRFSHSLSIYPEVMRVPLIVHLPPSVRRTTIYDETHLSALTDITPSLYYLLGHRPIRTNPLFGHPLFVESRGELERMQRNELFLASDERAVYGWLTENGRFLYATYDSPARSYLFDLASDPNALHNLLTDSLKRQYDEQIIEELQAIAAFYGYKPGVGALLAAAH